MDTEMDLYGAFGLEAPQPEGSGEDTGAPGPGTEEPSGEEVRENAGSAEEQHEDTQQPEETASSGSEEDGDGSPRRQSREENARYANIRRQAEQDVWRKANQLIAGLGLLDPVTNEPVTTREQAESYRDRVAQNQRQEMMTANGWTQQQYDQFLTGLPEIRQAREQAEAARAAAAQAQLDRELAEVREMDPGVSSLQDLSKRPEYGRICGYVQRGLTLVEAYKLTYGEQMAQLQAEAAKQAAVNAANGKAHLQQTGQRGIGGVTVPADVMAEYRRLNPYATDEEIQRSYQEVLRARNS